MRRVLIILVILILVGAAGGGWWWHNRYQGPAGDLALYGNVDLRQVSLAFNNSERIAEILVQEGDRVHKGQVLARLDTRRLAPQVAQVDAQVAAQRQAVDRLHNGNRPEEIAQARANVAATQADAVNAKRQYDRLHSLASGSGGRAVSQQNLDNARATLDTADAKLAVNQKAFDLEAAGARKEDIAQAEAQLRGNEAQLAFLHQQLIDADLLAPSDAVVRSRILEPGEMATPQRPVFSLAITDPKWVRAYVSETDLGKLKPGEAANIYVDSFPDRAFEGWVGFISPVAEFTPKAVQTEELRPSLVYEVRVFAKDPDDTLRLGMPATVHLPLDPQTAPAYTGNK